MALQFKRRPLRVEPGFQARPLFRAASHLVIFAVLVWLLAAVMHSVGTLACSPPAPGGPGVPRADPWTLRSPLVRALLLCLPLVLVDVLLLSHRVAAPLYRCRQAMLDMAAGKAVAEFRARRGDEMAPFFEAFNALVREWNARLADGAGRPGLGDRAGTEGNALRPAPNAFAAAPRG